MAPLLRQNPPPPHLLITTLSTIITTLLLFSPTLTAAQSPDCTDVLVSLAPCIDYITSSSDALPSPSCCSQLANVVNTQPRCLCLVIGDGGGGVGADLGFTLNRTRALGLPKACNVQTPPVSKCNASPQSRSQSSSVTPTSNSSPSSPGIGVPTTLPLQQRLHSSNGQTLAAVPSALLFLMISLFFISHSA